MEEWDSVSPTASQPHDPWARPLLSLESQSPYLYNRHIALLHSVVEMIRCVHTREDPGSETSTCTHT